MEHGFTSSAPSGRSEIRIDRILQTEMCGTFRTQGCDRFRLLQRIELGQSRMRRTNVTEVSQDRAGLSAARCF